MAPLQWLSSRTSFGSTSTPNNPPQLENGSEMANLGPQRERSDQILHDINQGTLDCTICIDSITSADVQAYRFWHCPDCYNVFHFQCVQALPGSLSDNWQCPTCRKPQARLRRAMCWCGARPEACTRYCVRRATCAHGVVKTCRKECHPGPCSAPCSRQCASSPPPPPPPEIVQRGPTGWSRFCDRWRDNSTGCGVKIVLLLFVVVVVYALLSVFLHFHIKWWTEPYNYPSFHKKGESGEIGGFCISAPVYLFCSAVALALLWLNLTKFLSEALNLSSTENKLKRKLLTKYFGGGFLLVIFAGLFVYPIVGFAAGPVIAWYNQMKDSCKGFETRVDMDSGYFGFDSRFKFRSLSPNVDAHDFYLATRFEPNFRSNASTFEYFYRLSGSTDRTKNVAIDVDIENRAWRLLKLNDTDVANKWLAYDFRNYDQYKPTFKPISYTVMEKGTFSDTTNANQHMHIHGLGMSIVNMYLFMDDRVQEPFLQVYDTRGLDDGRAQALMAKKWSSESDGRVIMRTASFGHGRKRLDMCVKESEGYVANTKDGLPMPHHWVGVDDRNLVPFAIVAAFRDWLIKVGGQFERAGLKMDIEQ